MTPWTRQRQARWLRRYLAVDSGKYAGRVLRKPWWLWWAFQASLWLAFRLRWPWLSELAHYFCRPKWVGMDGCWDPWPRWCRRDDDVPF